MLNCTNFQALLITTSMITTHTHPFTKNYSEQTLTFPSSPIVFSPISPLHDPKYNPHSNKRNSDSHVPVHAPRIPNVTTLLNSSAESDCSSLMGQNKHLPKETDTKFSRTV